MDKILNQIKGKFTFNPINWERLAWLIKSNQPISFYSWECPPRQKIEDKKYGEWINFDIDIKKVVEGKKIDPFTELPRLTTQVEQEQWFINLVRKIPNATYTKIIADTNGLYLFPKSKKILGDKKIMKLSRKFQGELKRKAQEIYGNSTPKIILLNDLIKPFTKEYESFFNLILVDLKSNKPKIVKQRILKHWTKRISQHVGISEEKRDIIYRAIASYAAEGMMFQILSNSGILPNPIWANFEEPTLNGMTTEILRERYGIEPIPILYFVSKEDGH